MTGYHVAYQETNPSSRLNQSDGERFEVIEEGLNAKLREKEHFFDVAERLATSKNPDEQRRLKEELARLTFGE